MSDARAAMEALMAAGVDQERARDIVYTEVGEDPGKVQSARVTLTYTVEVELDADDLDGVTEDDEDTMVDIADDKVDISGWGVTESGYDRAEVDDIELET